MSGVSATALRKHNSAEPVTLDDYRNRYALYKSDPDLQAAHAAFPWAVTWDGHEVENNYAGLIRENNKPASPALDWASRRPGWLWDWTTSRRCSSCPTSAASPTASAPGGGAANRSS